MKTEEVLKVWRDVVVVSISCGNQPGESIAAANRVCMEYAKFVEKVNNASRTA